MEQSAIIFAVLAGAVFLLIGALANHTGGSLSGIKAKTEGDGQHGTARWATGKELKRTYQYIPFRPAQWRHELDTKGDLARHYGTIAHDRHTGSGAHRLGHPGAMLAGKRKLYL